MKINQSKKWVVVLSPLIVVCMVFLLFGVSAEELGYVGGSFNRYGIQLIICFFVVRSVLKVGASLFLEKGKNSFNKSAMLMSMIFYFGISFFDQVSTADIATMISVYISGLIWAVHYSDRVELKKV